MWDLNMGTLICAPLEGHDDTVNSVAFSPNGTKLTLGSNDKTIQLWSVKMQALIGKPVEVHSMSVAFSHDTAFIMSDSDNRTI